MQQNHIILLQNYAVMHTILQSKEERLTGSWVRACYCNTMFRS